jgi:hypothetical protein
MEAINVRRVEYLDTLIRTKASGTPSVLAKKLKISERSLYYHLKFIKELGAPVRYCKLRNCYYYAYEGKITVAFL